MTELLKLHIKIAIVGAAVVSKMGRTYRVITGTNDERVVMFGDNLKAAEHLLVVGNELALTGTSDKKTFTALLAELVSAADASPAEQPTPAPAGLDSLTMTVTEVSEQKISNVTKMAYVVVSGTASGTPTRAILRGDMIAKFADAIAPGNRITLTGEANKGGFRPVTIESAIGEESLIEAPAPKASAASKVTNARKPAARKAPAPKAAAPKLRTYQFRLMVKYASVQKTRKGEEFTVAKVDVINRKTGEVMRPNVKAVAFGGAHANISRYMRRGKTLELSGHYNNDDLIIDGRRAGAGKAEMARKAA